VHKVIHCNTVTRQEATQHPSGDWTADPRWLLSPPAHFLQLCDFELTLVLLDHILSWELKTMTLCLFRISQARSNTILHMRTIYYYRMASKVWWKSKVGNHAHVLLHSPKNKRNMVLQSDSRGTALQYQGPSSSHSTRKNIYVYILFCLYFSFK
jgi:hypothetical protein